MYSGLKLEQAPPLSAPLRFFVSAPLFGMLAALGLFWFPESLLSRWSPALLGLTHLLTLGVLTMVMCGALLQMLPVVAGSPVVHVKRVAGSVHVLLCLGTLSLAVGFAISNTVLLKGALLLLSTAFVIFISALARSLLNVPRVHDTVRGMGLALLALLITAAAGLFLLSGHGWDQVPLWRGLLTDLHASWGFLGWTGLLLIAVAYQVVPMLQMTANYPAWLSRWLVPILFALLLLCSVLVDYVGVRWILPGALLVALGYAVFAATTLYLQQHRRRRVEDISLKFWRLGMAASIVAIALWLYALLWPQFIPAGWEIVLGLILTIGFALSVINGMLYKIVPFLVWFHLQQCSLALPGGHKIPAMRSILAVKKMRRQFQLHRASCVLLLAAVFQPNWFARPAALVWLGSFLLLAINLVSAYRVYRREMILLDTSLRELPGAGEHGA